MHGQDRGPISGYLENYTQNAKRLGPLTFSTITSTKAEINQATRNAHPDGHVNSAKSYLCRLLAPEDLPNLGLFVAGVIGIIIAIGTLTSIKEQAQSAQIAAEASKASAETALKNVQLLVNTERAIIGLDLVNPTTYIDPETGEECSGVQLEDYGRYGISAMNHGRTVARITCYKIWSDCSKHEEFNQDRFKLRFESNDQELLGANKTLILGNFEFGDLFTEDEWESVRSGTKNAMVRIDATYQDVLKDGPDGQHMTSATFRWEVRKEEPIRMAKYNVYT